MQQPAQNRSGAIDPVVVASSGTHTLTHIRCALPSVHTHVSCVYGCTVRKKTLSEWFVHVYEVRCLCVAELVRSFRRVLFGAHWRTCTTRRRRRTFLCFVWFFSVRSLAFPHYARGRSQCIVCSHAHTALGTAVHTHTHSLHSLTHRRTRHWHWKTLAHTRTHTSTDTHTQRPLRTRPLAALVCT